MTELETPAGQPFSRENPVAIQQISSRPIKRLPNLRLSGLHPLDKQVFSRPQRFCYGGSHVSWAFATSFLAVEECDGISFLQNDGT